MEIKRYVWIKAGLLALIYSTLWLSNTDFKTEVYGIFAILTVLEIFFFVLFDEKFDRKFMKK